MAKPSLRGIWARGGTKVDVTSMADTGFAKTALEYAKLNGILYQQGEWADFVDRAFGKTYYVQCSTGSDTTGDGTSSYPFQTIKKACDSIEDGGYGTIMINETGDYHISGDIFLVSKNIWIREAVGVNGNLIHDSYLDSGGINNLYGFSLSNSSLHLSPNEITIDSPDDAGKDWNNDVGGKLLGGFACAYYSGIGKNFLNIDTNEINFSATPATGGFPAVVYQDNWSGLEINTRADIVTNDQGYFLAYYSGIIKPVTIVNNVDGSIDNPLFRVLNAKSSEQVAITTGVMSALSANFRISIDEASTSYTNQLTDDDSEADIKAEIEALFLRNTGLTVVATVACTYDGSSKITSISVIISGLKAKRLSFPLSVIDGGLTHDRYFYEIEPSNIITN